MLNWQLQPDEAFSAIVDSALSGAIEHLSETLAEGNGEADPLGLFSERVGAIFDGEQLLAELRKLLLAHQSPKLYMPSDYHFLLLHDVLQHEIECHNDRVYETGRAVACGDVPLLLIDFDFVRDFFWDQDFLLEQQVMDRLSEEDKERLGFNPETFALVQGLKPHPKELELVEVRDEPMPMERENVYKPGGCYPWFEERQPFEEPQG